MILVIWLGILTLKIIERLTLEGTWKDHQDQLFLGKEKLDEIIQHPV